MTCPIGFPLKLSSILGGRKGAAAFAADEFAVEEFAAEEFAAEEFAAEEFAAEEFAEAHHGGSK